MIQVTERLLSTKELVVQMTTAFFAPVPLFGGQLLPLFCKNSTALAFLNSPEFHFSKYVKMSKWPKIA